MKEQKFSDSESHVLNSSLKKSLAIKWIVEKVLFKFFHSPNSAYRSFSQYGVLAVGSDHHLFISLFWSAYPP